MIIQPSFNRGIALMMVMMIVLFLTILAGGFAYAMRVEMRLARNSNSEADLEWLGRAGVEMAKYVLSQQMRIPNEGSYMSLNQVWAGGPGGTNTMLEGISLKDNALGAGSYSVEIIDLERKFNINLADQNFLQQALILMGVQAADFPAIVDSILDWIDADETRHLAGSESDYYLTLNPPYRAKNGLIDDLSELLLIKGVTPELYHGSGSNNDPSNMGNRAVPGIEQQLAPIGLVDIFTPLSSGRININTASLVTLEMIPEITQNEATAIVQMRAGQDGIDGTDDDVPFRSVGELRNIAGISPALAAQLQRFCDVQSHTFEIKVTTVVAGYEKTFIALLRRSAGNAADLQVVKFSWR